jgi:hemerythrin-like metal-binding protein
MSFELGGWDPSLEVGEADIDEQHRCLFNMILELDGRMVNQDYGQGLLDALQGMKAYAYTHFGEEEAMMERAGWTGLAEHAAQHAQFMQRTSLFGGEALIDSEWTSLDLLRYLLKWLRKHIMVEDLRFFEWRASLPK